MTLPHWDSIEATRLIHRWAWGTGIFFFALLVIFEGIAHWSEKKHIVRRCGSLAIAAFALAIACEAVDYFYENRWESLQQKREENIYSRLGPRRLTEAQRKELAEKAAKYSRVPVDLFVLDQENRSAMDEALTFGKDIVAALGQSMDASGFIGHGCRPWPVTGVIVEATQDLGSSLHDVMRKS